MKRNGLALASFLTLAAGAGQAASIDFTDGVFSVISTNGVGAPLVIEEVADGVTFTISAFTENLAQRVLPTSAGLYFGIPGGGMQGFRLTADTEVKLTSISGISDSVGAGGPLQTDYSAPGYGPFNIGWPTASSTVGLFGGGPVLAVGDIFTVDHRPYTGVLTQGNISAIGFETIGVPPSPVPLPASLPLLLAGVGAFGVLRVRRRA